jgi:dihydrofolate reductase
MKGGTVFHFVTDGIESALGMARKAANGKDIRIGGGTSTIRQFLQAGYIDEMHLAFAPVFLGSREHLFAGPDSYRVDLPKLGFTETQTMYGKGAAHVILKKSK